MTEFKHANQFAQTAQFYEMAMKTIINDHVHTFKQIATNDAVKSSGHILAWGGYDRNVLLNYVEEYGYESVNLFVADLRKRLEGNDNG